MKNPSTISSGESDEPLWKVAFDAFSETASKRESIQDAWQRVADRVAAALATQPAEFKGRAYDFTVSRDYDISMPPSVQAGTESKACASVGVALTDAEILRGLSDEPWPSTEASILKWGRALLQRAALASPAPSVGEPAKLRQGIQDLRKRDPQGLTTEDHQLLVDCFHALATPPAAPAATETGGCGNAECEWHGPLSECSYVGTVGPCCPRCREIVEPDAPAATEAPSRPFAYYIHIAAEQRGEFVHDLDEALDDLTNCECKITELFDHATPAPAVGASVQPVLEAIRSVVTEWQQDDMMDRPIYANDRYYWKRRIEAVMDDAPASVQPVLASLSDGPGEFDPAERTRAWEQALQAEAKGIERAAQWVDVRRANFEAQHGAVDPETGTLEFGRGAHAEAKREYSGELAEIAEGLRDLMRCTTPTAGWTCSRVRGHSGPCAASFAALASSNPTKGGEAS